MTTVAGISPVITRRGEALVRVKQRKKIHRRLTAVASRNEKVDGALGKSLPEDETQRLDLGTRLLGAVTETLVRAPTAFVVERVLAPLYPERECGPGRYRDPETDSCVFLCREGYVWDAETKSCKLIVGNSAGRAAMVSEHVPAVGRKPPSGKAMQPIEAPHDLPNKLERRFYGHEDTNPFDAVIRWCVNRLMNVRAEEQCAVGFFYDKVGQRCTPICKPGYVYDPVTKRCLKADEALHS